MNAGFVIADSSGHSLQRDAAVLIRGSKEDAAWARWPAELTGSLHSWRLRWNPSITGMTW